MEEDFEGFLKAVVQTCLLLACTTMGTTTTGTVSKHAFAFGSPKQLDLDLDLVRGSGRKY